METENVWVDKSLVQKILYRQTQVESYRQPYDDRFSEIVDFCDPGLTAWSTHENTEGKFRGEKVYEGTPPWALRVMADGWLGSLVSQSLRWFKYLFPDKELRENDEVSAWMQEYEDTMYSWYRNSELYVGLSPFTRAALSVGSPVIMPWWNKKTRKIECDVPHPKESFHGPYQSYHRKYKITVVDAVMKFLKGKVPEDINDPKNKLSYKILSDWNNGLHGKKHEFIRAIYQQDDPILDGQPVRFRNKPWMEFYVESNVEGEAQKNDPVMVEGDFTKPHIRWDWEINTDELYARTPAWAAMNDIRSGQEIEGQKIKFGQRILDPPVFAMRKFRGHMNLAPHGVTWYGTAAEQGLKPEQILDQPGAYPVADEQSKQQRRNVERWFQTDFFQLISRLTAENTGSWPTATQILQLHGEKAVVLAPRVGRFMGVLRNIDTRFTDIAQRQNELPPPPDIVLEYMMQRRIEKGETELDIDVDFLSPLAVIQQRAETLGRSEEALAVIERYVTLDPMLLKKVRLDVAMEKDLESVRFSQDAIVSEEEYMEVLAAIAEAEQQEKQAALLAEAADAVPKLSGQVEENSPLAALAEEAA